MRRKLQPFPMRKILSVGAAASARIFGIVPTVANLRYWAKKNKVKIIEGDEVEILEAARIAFLTRIEQFIRKSEQSRSRQNPV